MAFRTLLFLVTVPTVFTSSPPCVVELPGLVAGLVSTQVDVVSPGHRTQWLTPPPLHLELLLVPPELAAFVDVCVSVDGGKASCTAAAQPAVDWPPPLPAAPGWHSVEAYVDRDGHRVDCHLPEHDTIEFEIVPVLVTRRELPRPHRDRSATLVSAANAPYFARLANLVGSAHHWEPGLPISIYDLGLEAPQAAVARTWADTTLFNLDDTLPAHVRFEPRLVGWKPWVLLDALASADGAVLWLDANTEIRRPLDDIFAAIEHQGYFLSVAGHRFPTDKTTRPKTLDFFGCRAPHASRPECTSAFVGVQPNSTFHALLPALHACALDRDCLYPPDAIANLNQRRDQSALNAALCVANATFVCDPDRRFWMWHGQRAFLPTEDPRDANDLVFFSRRGHAHIYEPRLAIEV